jgi:hypothetical protein
MFGQVLDKLATWVGRPFLLASFFPFLIFLAANAVMAQFLTPGVARSLVDYFKGGVYGPVSATVTCLAAAAAFAYITDPLVAVMTSFLEGAYFPPRVAGWLATDQTKRARDLDENIQRNAEMRGDLAKYKKQLSKELDAANETGLAIGAMRDLTLIVKAQKAIDALARKQSTLKPIGRDELRTAAAKLQLALQNNCMGRHWLAQGATGKEKRYSDKLFQLFSSMISLADYAHKNAVNEYSLKVQEKQMSFALIERPTKFGNYSAALRDFFDERFQFDFDFFWPIVKIVSQSDQKTMDALTDVQQKLEFSIRILLYTIVFTATWLAVGAMTADRELTVLLIGTGGFVIVGLWVEIVHSNFRSLSEMIRSIVIVKRFDVLEQLHQPLPESWEEEKKLWDQITTQLLWGSDDAKIKYQHTDK